MICQYIVDYQWIFKIVDFSCFPIKRKFSFIYAILARLVLYIYAKDGYDYTFMGIAKAIMTSVRPRLLYSSLLNVRSSAPKLPPKNSYAGSEALVRTGGSFPAVPQMFRIGGGKMVIGIRFFQPHLFALCAYLCRNALVAPLLSPLKWKIMGGEGFITALCCIIS